MAKKTASKQNISAKKEPKSSKKKKTATEGVTIQISILKKAPKNKEFILADGRKLSDIRELAFALADMADDIFWHHVNDTRNDFVNWVKDVLNDEELANNLNGIRDRFNAQLAILRHIASKI